MRSGHREVQDLLLQAGAMESVQDLQEEIEVEEYEAKSLGMRAKAEKWWVNRNELWLGQRLGEGEQVRVHLRARASPTSTTAPRAAHTGLHECACVLARVLGNRDFLVPNVGAVW